MSNSLTYLGRTYIDEEIMSGTSTKFESLNMSELSVDTAEFVISPTMHYEFETHDPYPFYTHDDLQFETSEADPLLGGFTQNTPVVQKKDGSQIAIWYLQSKERLDRGLHKLSVFSSLGRLTQTTHYGGIYNNTAASTIIADICGNIPYYINPVFASVPMTGWLPVASARDNLQQVLFALNAALTTSAEGVLRIDNLPDSVATAVAANDIYASAASVKDDTPVTDVVVLAHQFISQNTNSTTLFDGVATAGQVITFNEPMSNLSATGFSITSSGANYAVLSAGTGVLTGYPYIHTTREITRAVSTASVPNVVRVENATMVDSYAVIDVADRLKEFYKCRKSINVSVANMRADAGSVINIYDPYDEVMRQACIASNQLVMSATQKSAISALVGFMPWQTGAFTNEHILVTTSSTYTFPNTLNPNTEVTAVLIGGGQGGTNGANGANGTGGMDAFTSSSASATRSWAAGVGGAGGAGGDAGSGGNVLVVSFLVNASTSATISVGAGGAVGGGLGGNTTLTVSGTTYTSASGSPGEYYDPYNNTNYGADGTAGISGGNGGNGGTAAGQSGTDGTAGQAVGEYTGGTAGRWGGAHFYDAEAQYKGDGWCIRGGGGGGGAANGAAGSNGGTSTGYPVGASGGVNGGYGGNGANGSSDVQIAANYGDGGSGGHGGGGGGGAAGSYYTINNKYGTFEGHAIFGANTYGTGGTGSAGTAGKQGCVILIYRKPAS